MARLRRHLAARIRWKILGPYLLLSLLLAGLATYLLTRVVSGSLEERFVNQLAESARVANDSIVRRERDHLEVVRAVTFTEGIPAAIEDGSPAALEQIVLPIAANNGAEIIEVFDATGTLRYSAARSNEGSRDYAPVPDPLSATRLPLVDQILRGRSDARGDKFTAILAAGPDSIVFTGGPIRSGDQVVGAVIVGSRLGSLLLDAKRQVLADITVYDAAGTPLASTFVIDRGNAIVQAPDLGRLGAGPAPRDTQLIAARHYQFLYSPMYFRGESIGVLSVALPTSFVTSADRSTQLQMATLFGLATIAVLLIGLLLARLLTAPLTRLVRTATAVAAGDLTARSGVVSSDEIGTLAATFDTMTERLQRQHLGTIRALVSAIDARDPYTRGHSVRVGQLSVEIGHGLGLSESQLQHLQVGGYLHDIGKIGVRDAILLKPGSLTVEERRLIEEHPRVGLEILEPVLLPSEVLSVVGQHHERLDGSGYPFALSAEELSIFPRVAAVADVYDALTTDRPYRGGLNALEALSILGREVESGLLDPEVVAALIRCAALWEQRRRDDPQLKGLEPAGGLFLATDAPWSPRDTGPHAGAEHDHVA
jgi:putative nucleotidyltransferase with HDIG domain